MMIVYYSALINRVKTYGDRELGYIHECILGAYNSAWDKEVIQNLTHTVASIRGYGVINHCNIYDKLYHVKIPLVTKAILSQNMNFICAFSSPKNLKT